MVSYSHALQEGLAAAQESDRAKREIDEVFLKLDMEIREASSGKLSIKRHVITKMQANNNPIKLLMSSGELHDTYWAIVAFNPRLKQSPDKELARWKQDRAGYPCKISLDTFTYICEDKEALENKLAAVASNTA